MIDEDTFKKCWDLKEKYRKELATARAVAMEEAARMADAFNEDPRNYSLQIARNIRTLASLPSTLVVVERKTLEMAQWVLANGSLVVGDENVRNALALLDAALGAK